MGKRRSSTPDPIDSNYAGVVSRDSVRIALTYAALNGLDICAADICLSSSAYIGEKLYHMRHRIPPLNFKEG